MRTLPSTYLNAAKAAARYPDIRVTIDELVMTGSSEVTSVHITRGSTSKPTGFVTADAVGSTGTITIDRRALASGVEANIESGESIVVEALFRNSTGTIIASAKIYTGIIVSYYKQDKTAGIISITDAMANTGIDYNPEFLDYSEFGETYLSDIVADAFDQAGIPDVVNFEVELDIDPIVNEPPYKAEEPVAEGMKGAPYSCREIIAAIAGMNLACYFIDAEGTPKLYQYGAPSTTAVTDSILTELKTTDETFGLDRIKIFKTAEKMAKTAVNYRTLPYGPRLPEMITLDSESTWYEQIMDKKDEVLHWDWMTATAKIQGVGEIEPGDRVQFVADSDTIKMFVTAIVYDFENAHFTETLYSFAQTEQEYKMTPPGQTNVSTKSTKDTTPQTYYSATDPANSRTVKAKDMWYQLDSSSTKIVTTIKRRKLVSAASSQSDPVYEWEVVANIPAAGSGGVGEDLGNGNERFNDYIYNIMTNVQGYNRLTGCHNTISNGAFACDVGGEFNTLTSNGGYATFVRGNGNRVTGSSACAVFGENNTVNAHFSLTTGRNNTVTGYAAAAVGDTNTADVDGSFVCGQFADTQRRYILAVGGSNSGNNFAVEKGAYGHCLAKGYDALGADYAEYVEWEDGNPFMTDRTGLLVTLEGDRIIPAHGEDLIGAVSARASVIGNAYEDYWHGKYLTDIYGRVQHDHDGNALISPDFDPERKYIPRSKRPEWAVVGLVGRLIVRDDGSCRPGCFIIARRGIATFCRDKTPGRVLKRIDGEHIEILLK